MIKYELAQKIALVRKLELYMLENNLSFPKTAKLLKCHPVSIKFWMGGEILPKTSLCYRIEVITQNFEPTLHKDQLDADNILRAVQEYKQNILNKKLKG